MSHNLGSSPTVEQRGQLSQHYYSTRGTQCNNDSWDMKQIKRMLRSFGKERQQYNADYLLQSNSSIDLSFLLSLLLEYRSLNGISLSISSYFYLYLLYIKITGLDASRFSFSTRTRAWTAVDDQIKQMFWMKNKHAVPKIHWISNQRLKD